MHTLLISMLFVGWTPGPQEPPRKAEGPVSSPLDEFKKAAAEYRIVVDSSPAHAPALKPEPVLKWNNPLRATVAGATFLWVADGRPEVIGCLYRYTYEGVQVEDHEFQSLADSGLTATLGGVPVWSPPSAGIKFAPIPGAPVPASNPVERLRQMRALSREFKAGFNGEKDKTEFRLLSQPLYRYEPTRADLIDGALFAFVQTTDPEVLLAIEARNVDGKPAWYWGVARMSMVNLRAEHKGTEVWTADWVNDLSAPNKPYITRTVSKRLP
jgi:hypothetical protein